MRMLKTWPTRTTLDEILMIFSLIMFIPILHLHLLIYSNQDPLIERV